MFTFTCSNVYRLIPLGNMSLIDLFDLLARLTIHIDEDLRHLSFNSLLSFAQDFPELREDVVGTYVSFIMKQASLLQTLFYDFLLQTLF